MPRYIDADILKSYFAPTLTGRTEYSADEILLTIGSMPTVDAEPIRHGRWINHGWSIVCSECGEDYAFAKRNFCPNCGAKMDEVGK